MSSSLKWVGRKHWRVSVIVYSSFLFISILFTFRGFVGSYVFVLGPGHVSSLPLSLWARILSLHANSGKVSLVFTFVFVLIWAGAAVITVNGQLLGGKMYAFLFPLILVVLSSRASVYLAIVCSLLSFPLPSASSSTLPYYVLWSLSLAISGPIRVRTCWSSLISSFCSLYLTNGLPWAQSPGCLPRFLILHGHCLDHFP